MAQDQDTLEADSLEAGTLKAEALLLEDPFMMGDSLKAVKKPQ